MNYTPINYGEWDLSGKGNNIQNLLNDKERKIWESARQFQDSREGEKGHGETVTYFALKLTEMLKGNRSISVPAAILHDIGWSQMTETELKLFYESGDDGFGNAIWQRYEPILRARHQEQGVKLAEKILKGTNSSPDCLPKILEIISQHDTRKGFLSLEDGIVRDADKLWRYTLPCFKIAADIRGLGAKGTLKQLSGWVSQEGFFYSDISRQIAKIEIENVPKDSYE